MEAKELLDFRLKMDKYVEEVIDELRAVAEGKDVNKVSDKARRVLQLVCPSLVSSILPEEERREALKKKRLIESCAEAIVSLFDFLKEFKERCKRLGGKVEEVKVFGETMVTCNFEKPVHALVVMTTPHERIDINRIMPPYTTAVLMSLAEEPWHLFSSSFETAYPVKARIHSENVESLTSLVVNELFLPEEKFFDEKPGGKTEVTAKTKKIEINVDWNDLTMDIRL